MNSVVAIVFLGILTSMTVSCSKAPATGESGLENAKVSTKKPTRITCNELQGAVSSGNVKVLPWSSVMNGQQLNILKRALVQSETLTAADVRDVKDFSDLEDIADYDPLFNDILIGSRVFQAVNLSLGGNPYIYLYDFDKSTFSALSSEDDSVVVQGNWCDVGDENPFVENN